jgi:hypothetical protein
MGHYLESDVLETGDLETNDGRVGVPMARIAHTEEPGGGGDGATPTSTIWLLYAHVFLY